MDRKGKLNMAIEKLNQEIKSLSENAIETGQRLIEVKKVLGPERFEEWLDCEMPFGLADAHKFMRIAETVDELRKSDKLKNKRTEFLVAARVAQLILPEYSDQDVRLALISAAEKGAQEL